MENKFKSQIGQDKYISEVIFKNKRNGYFIELGAVDGIKLSNSYYFEKELDWNGICIEPNPTYNKILSVNRNCITLNELIYSESGILKDFNILDNDELSGMQNHLGNIGNSKLEKCIKLKTKTLTEILDEHNAPNYIDYLSLDTEGSELEILKGLDMNKYTIGYISVEHNYTLLRSNINSFLLKNNYIYSRWNRFDDEYIHQSLASLFAWSHEKTIMTPKIGK